MVPALASAASLPPLGRIAEYRGVEYRARLAMGSDLVTLYMSLDVWRSFRSDGEVTRGRPEDPEPWVKVGRQSVTRIFVRRARGTWFDVEVSIAGPVGRDALLVTYDGDPQWARARGMKGSQFESWWAEVPASDIHNIQISEA